VLIAELHGKIIEEVQNSEDCLMSCIFGHLRYLPPSVFWEQFLSCAISAPVVGGSRSRTEVFRKQEIHISTYGELRVHFWPKHPTFGEPDLSLVFSGGIRPTVIFIEAINECDSSGRR
jgi:hypothetical protein